VGFGRVLLCLHRNGGNNIKMNDIASHSNALTLNSLGLEFLAALRVTGLGGVERAVDYLQQSLRSEAGLWVRRTRAHEHVAWLH
jgi:hypothetical protein